MRFASFSYRSVASSDGHSPIHIEEISIIRDGRLYFVYLQNITSIDAESGLSCDTTALRTSLSGGDLTVAYQRPPAIWCARRGPVHSFPRTFRPFLVWLANIGRPRFSRWMRLHFRSTTIRVVNADVQHFCLLPCDGSRTYHERQQKADSCEQDHFFTSISS